MHHHTLSHSNITPSTLPYVYKSIINDRDMSQNHYSSPNNANAMSKSLSQRINQMNHINASDVKVISNTIKALSNRNSNNNSNSSSNCNNKNTSVYIYNMNPKRKFRDLKLMQTNSFLKSNSTADVNANVNRNNGYSSPNNNLLGTISAYNSYIKLNHPTSTSNCISNENLSNTSRLKQVIYSISKHQLQSKQEGLDLTSKLNKLKNKKSYSIDKFKFKDIRKDKKVFKSMHLESNSKKNVFINLIGKEAISQSNQIANYSPLEIFALRKSLCKRFGLKLMEDDEQEIKIEREERYIKMFQTPEWVKETRKGQKREMEKIFSLRNKIKNRFYAFTHKVI